jgi:ribosomal-protein-alanine N-acetyltransferase
MGKGFMIEAIYPIIDFGFKEMNLTGSGIVGPENTASLRIMKSLGFTEEGRLREHYNKNDRLEDSLIFSLLKSEYLNRTGMR